MSKGIGEGQQQLLQQPSFPSQSSARRWPFFTVLLSVVILGSSLWLYSWLMPKVPDYQADRAMARNGKIPDKLKGAGSFRMKVFGALAGKGPKRVGELYMTCQLFKVYCKLGTIHLCRSVIRSIETARVFDFEEFPARDKVTYMYYTGRPEVLNENFEQVNASKRLGSSSICSVIYVGTISQIPIIAY